MRVSHSAIFLALLCGAGSVVNGQTVTASSDRLVTATGGGSEAVVLVRVAVPVEKTLTDVAGALAMAGIARQDLAGQAVGRSSDYNGVKYTRYFLFRSVVPVARLNPMRVSLAAVADAHPSGLDLTCTTELRDSPEDIDKTRARVIPELFRETRADAESLLIEGGFRPGEIVAVTEWIDRVGETGWRISLSLTMARLGAGGVAGPARISTVVTPSGSPYRIGAPELTASFEPDPAQTRAELLESLAPAGLTARHLVNAVSRPSYRINEFGVLSDDGPSFSYQFVAPASETDAVERLRLIPIARESGASVSYPVLLAGIDRAAVAKAARARAGLLAGLLGARVGELLGSAKYDLFSSPFLGRGLNQLVGSFLTARGEIFLREPAASAAVRYTFAAVGN